MNVLVSVFLLLIANISNIVMDNHMTAVYKSADLALKGIQDAERSGADVSILIEKFNAALGLMEQANTSKRATCFGYDSCLDSAATILNSIIKDSAFLKDEAIRISGYENVTVMGVYLPLIAFFLLLFVFYFYKTWKSFQRDRFLNMQIKERRDK
jgi:hypothetical protein